MKKTYICKKCHKKFIDRYSLKKRVFCSKKCSDEWKRISMLGGKNHFYGKNHTDKIKKKMSNLCKKRYKNGELKMLEWWKNPQKAEKIKRKISIKHIGKIGSKSFNWKGGKTRLNKIIRNSIYYISWRSKIYTRDNYICKICNQKGKQLNADHYPFPFSYLINKFNIKNLDDARNCYELWLLKWGRTLCKKCHKKTKNYGSKAIKWKPTNEKLKLF